MQKRADELDMDVPRERVWQAISQDLQPVKRNATLLYMKWAIAACIIGLAGFGLYKLQDNNKLQVASYQVPATSKKLPVIENQQLATSNQQLASNDKQQVTSNLKPEASNQQLASNNPNAKHQNLKPKTQNNSQPVITNNQLVLQQVENTFTQVINLQRAKVNTTPLNAENPSYFNDFTIEMKRMERDELGIKKDISKSGLTDELLDQLINIYQQKLNMLKQLQNEIHKTNNRFKQNRIPSDTTKTYFLNI